jgi:hypothetical protein
MPNPPTIINGQLIFKGSISGQVAVQAQPIAGNNLIFNLPNTVPNPNAVLSVIAVTGSTVTFGFAPPAPQSFNFSQITGTIATSQLGSVEGNGSKVQLTTGAAVSPVTSELGTAANYAILAYSGVTNTGASVITGGNVGSAPTTGPQAGFTFIAPAAIDNTHAAAARLAGNAAFAHYSALTPTQTGLANLSTNSGGGGVGIYQAGVFSGGALDIPTSITLDAQGNPGAVFVFISASTTILESGASILLVNGAQAANVVWCVGSSFTQIGNNNTMIGTILAYTSITLDGGVLNGRALAVGGGNGAVTIAAAEAITASAGTGSVQAGDVIIYDAFGNAVDSGILLSSLGGAAGVTTFNTRSGAVIPLSGDYASFYDAAGAAATAQSNAEAFATSAISTALASGTYGISITGNAATATTATSATTAGSTTVVDGVTVSGTPSTGQVLTATSPTTADWQTPSGGAVTFDQIGSGTNNAANTLTVGNSSTLTFTGSGVINASQLGGVAASGYALLAGAVFSGAIQTNGALNDGSGNPGASGSLLSSTGTSTAWVTQASILSGYAPLAGATFSGAVQATTVYATVALEVFAALKDGSGSSGNAGQTLTSTGGSVAWANALNSQTGTLPTTADNHITSGTTTLAAGTATIALSAGGAFGDTAYAVQLTFQSVPGGAFPGTNPVLYITNQTATGFTINSSDATDSTSIIGWTAVGY